VQALELTQGTHSTANYSSLAVVEGDYICRNGSNFELKGVGLQVSNIYEGVQYMETSLPYHVQGFCDQVNTSV